MFDRIGQNVTSASRRRPTMLNVRRAHPPVVITSLACFVIAFAGAALANEDSKSDDQNKQNQESAQQNTSQQQNTAEEANQTARQQDTQNQQNARNEQQQQTDQSEQVRQSSDQNQQSAQQNERQQDQAQQSTRQNQRQQNQQQNRADNAQNAPGAWPAPQRIESQRGGNQAAGNERGGRQGRGGGSLGVSIVRSDQGDGVTVMRIVPNTAAERMGLQSRDQITSLNGQRVRSVDDFISEIRNMSPGESIELQITRDGNQRTLRGELTGFSESVVQTQGPSGTRGFRQFRSYISPERSNSDQGRNEREGYARDSRENVQTSYNDRGESGRSQSGDLENRISRIEQQLDRLTEQVNRLNSQGQSQSAQRNVPSESGTR
jgi:hypothetical protein